ncbi:MAG: hypothetical protein WCH43_17145 [Verrucomicrobiota bacterium]
MKTNIVIASVSIGIIFSGCIGQPAGNQRAATGLPANTERRAERTGGPVTKIIRETFPSDVKGINFVITYDPARKTDYKAEHDSGVPLDSKYAKERDVDNGQVRFPCSGKTAKDFVIPKEGIVNVVSIKYDMTVCDKTDYVFTADTVFEIHTFESNAGIFTSSDVRSIPNKLDPSGGRKYLHSKNTKCNLDDRLFNAILAFCEKNHIRTH